MGSESSGSLGIVRWGVNLLVELVWLGGVCDLVVNLVCADGKRIWW